MSWAADGQDGIDGNLKKIGLFFSHLSHGVSWKTREISYYGLFLLENPLGLISSS